MKFKGLFLVFLLLVFVTFLPVLFTHYSGDKVVGGVDEFYFGVSFGGEFAEEALPLIDKVKTYTNLFIVNAWGVTTNETALNLVCDYAADSGLYFVVFFDFISRTTFPWHQQWLDEAPHRWGDKFLGVYLNDEHGERQIDKHRHFTEASDYDDATERFIHSVQYGATGNATSMLDAKAKGIQLFTADSILHWWVYLAGYDVVFTELGWNATVSRQIALGRGAAMVQGKDWGTIITWETDIPPYLSSGEQFYRYMVDSYRAGAKYVVVFNYPTYPEDNPYGILSDGQFETMQQFWQYIQSYPRSIYGVTPADTVLVLPKNYGWGMRHTDYITNDYIWGIWPEDEKSSQILENVQWMETRRNLQFDIIYEDPQFDPAKIYTNVVYWNTTLPAK
jgi:hypothetical protein